MPRRTYRQHVVDFSPTVLLGDYARRFAGGAYALMADMTASWSAQSAKALSFSDPNQPTDALALIGEERLSPRYAIDTDATYRERLKNAWVRWQQAGSERAIIRELEAAFDFNAEIVLDNEWDWDGTPYWSRFWVVVTHHAWLPQVNLGAGLVLDGTWTLGSTATPEEVDTARRIVRRWKPAHMICSHIIIVFDEGDWAANPPDGTWKLPSNRNQAACYWPG